MPGHLSRWGGSAGCPDRHLRLRRAALAAGRKLRRDPFAVTPFIGYHAGDDIGRWLKMGERLGNRAPAVFDVHGFLKNRDGRWLWPGFGENSRVLKWRCEEVEGKVGAEKTPIGWMPKAGDLDMTGLDIPEADWAEWMYVGTQAFRADLEDALKYFEQSGDRLPGKMKSQLKEAAKRLS